MNSLEKEIVLFLLDHAARHATGSHATKAVALKEQVLALEESAVARDLLDPIWSGGEFTVAPPDVTEATPNTDASVTAGATPLEGLIGEFLSSVNGESLDQSAHDNSLESLNTTD